jgi:hypothetical protein
MNRIIFFGIALCTFVGLFFAEAAAQVASDTTAAYITSGNGQVNIRMSENAQAFMEAMKSAEYQPSGFRVQLTGESGQGSQARANEVKARFISNYPNVDAYLVWEAPNFKIRVGDFRTKFEAAMFWKQIQAEFPNSYVVEDKINPGGKRK